MPPIREYLNFVIVFWQLFFVSNIFDVENSNNSSNAKYLDNLMSTLIITIMIFWPWHGIFINNESNLNWPFEKKPILLLQIYLQRQRPVFDN